MVRCIIQPSAKCHGCAPRDQSCFKISPPLRSIRVCMAAPAPDVTPQIATHDSAPGDPSPQATCAWASWASPLCVTIGQPLSNAGYARAKTKLKSKHRGVHSGRDPAFPSFSHPNYSAGMEQPCGSSQAHVNPPDLFPYL